MEYGKCLTWILLKRSDCKLFIELVNAKMREC